MFKQSTRKETIRQLRTEARKSRRVGNSAHASGIEYACAVIEGDMLSGRFIYKGTKC